MKWAFNPFTGNIDLTQVLEEAIAFNDLSDMPGGDISVGTVTSSGTGTFGNLDVDTLNLNGNVISDSTGTISFDNENLTTTGIFRILSDTSYIGLGSGTDDLTIQYDGCAGVFTNTDVTCADADGKLQFYGSYIPTTSPSSTKANTFNGVIDISGSVPASNADFVGNEFNAEYQSNDTTAGFPAIKFEGTKFTNLINLNSSGAPRFQTGDFRGVIIDNDFTGAYSTVAGFNAIPIAITNDFTASVSASHQMIGLSLINTYNASNTVNQNVGISIAAVQSLGTTANLTGIYGTLQTTTSATISNEATIIKGYIRNVASTFNTALASGKKLINVYADFNGYTAMAARDTYGFYTNLTNNARNFSFVSDGADGWMNTDTGGWIFGAGKDAKIYFDGSDLIINSLNVTANDEVHFTNWDAIDASTAEVKARQVTVSTSTDYAIHAAKGKSLFEDAIYLTQTDGNEYIDSLADGYVDIGATTGIRLNSPLTRVTGDLYVGNNAAVDPAIVFDGDTNDGQITYKEDEDYFLLSSPLQVPYLGSAPATLTNGMIWMESDGLHIYYNDAEKVVAGS